MCHFYIDVKNRHIAKLFRKKITDLLLFNNKYKTLKKYLYKHLNLGKKKKCPDTIEKSIKISVYWKFHDFLKKSLYFKIFYL